MNICLNELPKSVQEDLINAELVYVTEIADASTFETVLVVSAPGYHCYRKHDYLESINLRHPIKSIRLVISMWGRSWSSAKRLYTDSRTIMLSGTEILELLETDSAPSIYLTD